MTTARITPDQQVFMGTQREWVTFGDLSPLEQDLVQLEVEGGMIEEHEIREQPEISEMVPALRWGPSI